MKGISQKNLKSLFLVVILAFILMYGRFLLPRFETHDSMAVISWDVFGYYLYLPAWFLHHDLGLWNFSWLQNILDVYKPTQGFYQAYQGPLGDYVMKYPCGMAIMYLPLFLTGHFFAIKLGFPADGFSLPYQISIAVGSVAYAFIGLWFLRKILLRYFPDGITSLTMIIIVLGTNYFELSAYDAAMPHNYLFVLYTLIVWFTIRWHEEKKWIHAVLMGLTMGLAVIVRPTEIICVLIPLLWNIRSVKERLQLIIQNQYKVLVMVIMMSAVIMIQLIYWKMQTGKFLYYSYESNEKLRLIAPYLLKVLFSYKKGWLVYAPVMIFALTGLYFLYKKNKQLFIPVISFFVINLIIVSSWPTWWYGGSLGQRALMQSYVILAFPLAAFIQWLGSRNFIIKAGISLVILFFIALNLFQTWQYMTCMIDPSLMTRKYYWTIFGRTNVEASARKYLEPEEYGGPDAIPGDLHYSVRLLKNLTFENDSADQNSIVTDPLNSGNHVLRMTKDMAFSPGLSEKYSVLTGREMYVWVRVSGKVYFTGDSTKLAGSLIVRCKHHRRSVKYRTIDFENLKLKPGQWNTVGFDYEVPYTDYKDDLVESYFWYRGEGEMLIDDFVIRLYELK